MSDTSDSDTLEHENEQPLAKKVKLHYDTQSCDSSQKSFYNVR